MIQTVKENWELLFGWWGTNLIRLFTLLALLSAVLFFFNIPITPWHFPAALLLNLIWSFIDLNFPGEKKRLFLIIIGFLGIFILLSLSYFIANWFFDNSFDGRWYHLISVFALKNGWNPVSSAFELPISINPDIITYTLHYPKAAWYSSATIYSFFNSIESSKLPNLLFAASVFFIAAPNLKQSLHLKSWQAIIIGGILALNPVQITQFLTKYIDGQLSACITIVLLTLGASFFGIKRQNIYALISAIIYGCALKSSAIVYFGIFVAFALIIHLLRRNFKVFSRLLLITGLSAAIGIFIVGFNPYITNTIQFQNPLYPLTLTNQELIMKGNRPADFDQMDRFTRFAKSILSPSNDIHRGGNSPKPKIPFTFSAAELSPFSAPDVRLGGFGPLFSSVLIIACFGAGFILFKSRKLFWLLTFFSLPIILSIFSTSEGWWARYAPQTWILPIIILAGLFILPNHKTQKIISFLLMTIIFLNISLVTYANISKNFEVSNVLHSYLDQAKQENQSIVLACSSLQCLSYDINLTENKVSYITVSNANELPCPTFTFMGATISLASCQK